MRLYLLRHAEAADTSPDPARALTPKGQRDARALGRLLSRREIKSPGLLWCSPYRRARETADALLEAAEWPLRPEIREGLTPYDDPADLLAELAHEAEDLLVVGHNPHLALLAGYLLGGVEGRTTVHFRKCGMICFERVTRYAEDPEPTWVLSWMLAPKLFRHKGEG
jgi:phosphohistidine phosphatase